MKHMIKVATLLVCSLILVVACSDDNKDKAASTKGNSPDTTAEKNNDTNSDNASEEDGDPDSSGRVENQFGLKLGETGVVENVDKMEVTLESARYENELGGISPSEEAYLVVGVTIKNIGETTFDGNNIYTPDISSENNENSAYINQALDAKKDGVKLLDGELKPGDSINGELVFVINKSKSYKIAFGHNGSQIVTRAEWELDDSEVK